ncbi:MAG: universal stress protein [Desulfuromonadales bacterium]|nr:universal stress protein [Desulfuromonadales bacterium]
MKAIKTILFATDFSESSNEAFSYALSFARSFNARLFLLHVISEPVDMRGFYVPHISFDSLETEIIASAKKMLSDFCAAHLKATDNFASDVVSGVPFEKIIAAAEQEHADLIVVGTHGRGGLDHLLFGSNAEKIVRKSPVPVLTVRKND